MTTAGAVDSLGRDELEGLVASQSYWDRTPYVESDSDGEASYVGDGAVTHSDSKSDGLKS